VLISLGGAIRRCDGNVLVIVDEAEHIFGAETPQEHRCRSTALSLLDSLRTSFAPARQVLFVFTTSNSRIGAELSRFDQTYHLGLPDEHERRSLVTDLLQNVGGTQYSKGEQHDSLLASIVDSTVGRSYSELVQYYRQAIETTVSTDGRMEPGRYRASLLVALKHRLQAITPESLRAGVCDDYVEMRVLAAHDLCAIASTGDESNSAFPMKGKSAALAWKALQTSIIIPLCRSKELHALLGEDDLGNRRSVLGAILLAGEPGSGKSEIAMHCAKHAAQLLPTMKLIDVSCTSLIHKEVGRSERAVHHLFDAARKAAPCIILMDGIENIAAVRGNDSTSEGTMDRVLSTLLVEMDGLDDGQKTQNGGIAVIGVTHDAAWIDPALKRPGRLDRAVRLDRDWM
jgi:SpoVK/Ycf46/Vps4 family AAA+-type ATPase